MHHLPSLPTRPLWNIYPLPYPHFPILPTSRTNSTKNNRTWLPQYYFGFSSRSGTIVHKFPADVAHEVAISIILVELTRICPHLITIPPSPHHHIPTTTRPPNQGDRHMTRTALQTSTKKQDYSPEDSPSTRRQPIHQKASPSIRSKPIHKKRSPSIRREDHP